MSANVSARAPARAPARSSGPLASSLLVAGLGLVLLGERVLVEGDGLGTWAGLGLVAVALAMRVRAFLGASGTQSVELRGVEQRLLLCYLGVVAALGLYYLSTETGLALLSLADEAAERASGALTAGYMAALLVSLSSVLFVELVYQGMPIPASVELRRVQTALHAGASLALSIVFLICVNYVATVHDVRKDVSYFRTSEPSEGTRQMLSRLDEKLSVTLFFRPGSDVLSAAKPYFDALAGSSKKLKLEVKDVALAPTLAQKHKIRDNGHVLLVTGQGDKEKGQFFRLGLELTEARGNLRKLDGLFQQSFSKLVRAERALLLTVGHGERNAKSSDRPTAEGTSVLNEVLLRLNLKNQSLGLSQGLGSAVPDGATAVAIVGPSERFLPEEVAALTGYVKQGGRLLLMLDPDKDVGLTPLLEGLSVKLLPGVVASDKQHMVANHNDSDRTIVFSNLYTSHPSVTTVTRNQREVASVFFQGAAIAKLDPPHGADESKQPKVTFPVRSAPRFFRDQNGNFTRDQNEPEETLNLMAAITVPVEGAQKPPADAAHGSAEPPEGRVVIVGDGDFMTDRLAPNAGNHLLFVDALAWLIASEELTGEVSSEEDRPIEHSRETDKIWFYGTTFAVPVPVALLGLWVARRRRRLGETKP